MASTLAGINLTPSQLEALEGMQKELTCSLCNDLLDEPFTTECFHTFCRKCISRHLREVTRSCPDCFTPQILEQLQPNGTISSIVDAMSKLKCSMDKLRARPVQETTQTNVSIPMEATERVEESQYSSAADTQRSLKGETVADNITTSREGTLQTSATITPAITTQQLDSMVKEVESLKTYFSAMESKFAAGLKQSEGSKDSSSPLASSSSSSSSQTKTENQEPQRVFCVSALSDASGTMRKIKKLIADIGGARTTNDFENDKPTHMIMGLSLAGQPEGKRKCHSTYKYYWALSAGCPVVEEAWIDECVKQQSWVDDRPFRVYAKSSEIDSSRPPAEPMLFTSTEVFLGPFSSLSVVYNKQQCKTLLEMNGAKVHDVGGEENGTVREIPEDIQQRVNQVTTPIVIVGHPSDSDHENGTCNFCANVCAAFKGKRIRIVDCAWVMLCLDALKLENISLYELAA